MPDSTMLWTAGTDLAWHLDHHHLPEIHILRRCRWPYPPQQAERRGRDDPWSIVGNHGLTIFPHASGGYQLLHSERGFVRLNHDGSEDAIGHACRAHCRVDEHDHDLLDGSADFAFGCGWARWRWERDGLVIERLLATAPSEDPADRLPGALLEIRIRNHRDDGPARHLDYREGLLARYHAANWCNQPRGRRLADYPVSATVAGDHLSATFHARARQPLVFAQRDELAQADGHPPTLHLSVLAGATPSTPERVDAEAQWLTAGWSGELAAGAEHRIRLAVGWADAELPWPATLARLDHPLDDLRAAWDRRLPRFPEASVDLAAELRWHAHVLHAMASWDTRYRCTFIPQGTLYEYGLGVAAVTRDHAMHALPTCHYDPALARSVLAYLARHSDRTGRIQHTDEGAGFVPLGCDQKSDSQLFALLLATEYLAASGDFAALADEEPCFPPGSADGGSLLARIGAWVAYLRDVIHVDVHGLVRICYSDISDTLHHAFREAGYPRTFNGGSHVNTGMAAVVCTRLAARLRDERVPSALRALAADIAAAAEGHARVVRAVLDRELAGRDWCPRGRVGEQVLGAEDVFSMAQAFVLADDERDPAERARIWAATRPAVWDDEAFGLRLRADRDGHRGGMVWAAWSGLFASSLWTVDPAAARATLERLRLRTRAERCPEQWVGLWSGSDCIAAARPKGDWEPGSVRAYCDPFPIFCAHVHAWPLQLWFESRIRAAAD